LNLGIGMKKLIWFIALLVAIHDLNAQAHRHRHELYPSRYRVNPYRTPKSEIDSLQKRLLTIPPDTSKVNLLNLLSQLQANHLSDTALLYAIQAEELARQLKYKKGEFDAINNRGSYYGTYGIGNLMKSLSAFQEMKKLALENNWIADIHMAYSCILNLYFYAGDFPAAMEMATDGLALAETHNNRQLIAHYKNLLGFIYLRQGNLAESRKNYTAYRYAAEAMQDSVRIMDAQISLAEVLLAEGKTESAIPLLVQANQFFISTLSWVERKTKTEKIPYSTFTLARAYRDKGDYVQALDLCLKGFGYSDSIQFNHYDLANYYLITGSVYEQLNQVQRAIDVYRLGLNLSLQIHHAEDIRDGYASLARIFAQQKRYDSAFHYEKLFSAMKDSIVNVRSRSEIQRINALYDIRKKDQELMQQRKLHEAELEQQFVLRNALLAGLVALAIIAYLLYNRYRLKGKHRLQEQLSAQRTEMLGNFIGTQNTERNRLARDIHDQVGTLLSAAKLKLSELEETLPKEEKPKLNASLETLDQAADSLRSISHNLMPASLSRLGLLVALEHFFHNLQEASPVRIEYASHNFHERLNENIETNLYPIVLELTNNVLKHATAQNLVVQLVRHPDRINLTLEDDGRGFDFAEAKKKSTGLGLASIESRVEILKGTFHLDSVLGRGTVAMVDVPV
jgi:two-component system NarL family sensor kinase